MTKMTEAYLLIGLLVISALFWLIALYLTFQE
jgi:hypothetical protein